eukprot:358714_1
MAEGWAKYCLSHLNSKYPKETNVGIAVTSWDIHYYGHKLVDEGEKSIDGKMYSIKGYNLKTGKNPDVTDSHFESHASMAINSCSVSKPSAEEVCKNINSFSQYKNTYISVIKLFDSTVGHVKIGNRWKSHKVVIGSTWYYVIAS